MHDFDQDHDLHSLANPLFLRDEELRQGMAVFFSVWRDLSQKIDNILGRMKLGRSHYYVLFFICQHQGLAICDLVDLMKITRQSLNRILAHLIEIELIDMKPGHYDRRKRILHLSEKGRKIENEITANQSIVFAQAYRKAGGEAVRGFHRVLYNLREKTETKKTGDRA